MIIRKFVRELSESLINDGKKWKIDPIWEFTLDHENGVGIWIANIPILIAKFISLMK